MSKKTIFLMVIMVLCLVACTKNLEDKLIPQSKERQFTELKNLSQYHSQGLDSVYSYLSHPKTRAANKEITDKEINDFVVQFVKTIPAYQIKNTRSVAESFMSDSIDNYKMTLGAEQIFNKYFDYLIHSSSKKEAEEYVESVISTKDFLSLKEQEQHLLAFMMYVGIDSKGYWSDPVNWEKWKDLQKQTSHIDKSTITRSMAGPPASYWMNSRQMNDSKFQTILKADCKGCILGASSVWSWATGGISGSAKAAYHILK